MNTLPLVPLAEIFKPVSRPERVDPEKTYRILGAHWYAEGLYVKDTLPGSLIRADKVFRVEKGDFVYNRLFAWKGSFAVATEANAGCYVSNEFPCFAIDQDRADATFLWRYFSRVSAWDEALGLSTGGTPTSRNRLKEEKFLAMTIPLPPLLEQRRIVARIEQLAAKINEARGLREKAGEAAEALVLSLLHRFFVEESSEWESLPMENAIEISDRQVDPTLPEYINLPHISGENMESKTCRLLPWRTADEDGVKSNNYLFGPGTVLYSKIRPYLRKVVFVNFAGVCSADVYPIRISNPELDPQFLKWTLVAEPFTEYANRLSGRTRMPKLNRKQLFGFDLKHPSLPDQRRIVLELEASQSKVDAVKKLQAKIRAELDALLPSILDRAFSGKL